MKKFICILLMVLMTVGVCACAGAKEPNAEQNSSAENSSVTENDTSKAASETAAADETSLLLAQLQKENEELKKKNTSLQADLDALQEQGFAFEDAAGVCVDVFDDGHGHRFVTLYHANGNAGEEYETYYMDINDPFHPSQPKLILKNGNVPWNISASPNAKQFLFQDSRADTGGTVWLYDIETDTMRVLEVPEDGLDASIQEYRCARYVTWLDDQHFLCVDGYQSYRIIGGETCYIYDLETDTFRKLMEMESSKRFQYMIAQIEFLSETSDIAGNAVFGSEDTGKTMVLLKIIEWKGVDDVWNCHYIVLTKAEIEKAIEQGKTITLTADMFL